MPALSFFKDFTRLVKTIDSVTDGQAWIDRESFTTDDENNCYFKLYICPNDGWYKDATCTFQVITSDEYPKKAPSVFCLNTVIHPNIPIESGLLGKQICVNLLQEDWRPALGLEGAVTAVLFLFHHPNTDDPLHCTINWDQDYTEESVLRACSGEELWGRQFDRLYPETRKAGKKRVSKSPKETRRNAFDVGKALDSQPKLEAKINRSKLYQTFDKDSIEPSFQGDSNQSLGLPRKRLSDTSIEDNNPRKIQNVHTCAHGCSETAADFEDSCHSNSNRSEATTFYGECQVTALSTPCTYAHCEEPMRGFDCSRLEKQSTLSVSGQSCDRGASNNTRPRMIRCIMGAFRRMKSRVERRSNRHQYPRQ